MPALENQRYQVTPLETVLDNDGFLYCTYQLINISSHLTHTLLCALYGIVEQFTKMARNGGTLLTYQASSERLAQYNLKNIIDCFVI